MARGADGGGGTVTGHARPSPAPASETLIDQLKRLKRERRYIPWATVSEVIATLESLDPISAARDAVVEAARTRFHAMRDCMEIESNLAHAVRAMEELERKP